MKTKELRGKRSVFSQLSKSGQQEVAILLKKYIATDEKAKKDEYYRRIQRTVEKQKDESDLRQKFGLVTDLNYEELAAEAAKKQLPQGQTGAQ